MQRAAMPASSLVVVIPTYRRSFILGAGLRHMADALRRHGVALYISDDSPDNDTQTMVEAFAAGLGSVRYQRNRGDDLRAAGAQLAAGGPARRSRRVPQLLPSGDPRRLFGSACRDNRMGWYVRDPLRIQDELLARPSAVGVRRRLGARRAAAARRHLPRRAAAVLRSHSAQTTLFDRDLLCDLRRLGALHRGYVRAQPDLFDAMHLPRWKIKLLLHLPRGLLGKRRG